MADLSCSARDDDRGLRQFPSLLLAILFESRELSADIRHLLTLFNIEHADMAEIRIDAHSLTQPFIGSFSFHAA
jgi:hypothetical protein